MTEISAPPIMSIFIIVINQFLELSDVNTTPWNFIYPDTSTKQPLLEPTCPITFQVSAGFFCDSGRPRFRFWESPPNASWRRQMVRLVQTGFWLFGSENEWMAQLWRERCRRVQPRDQSEDTSCVFLAAEPDTVTGLFGFCIMKLNVRWCLKHSSGKASIWNRSGVDDIRFLIFSLLFSLTAPDRFNFLLSILWWKASTWHCYYVRLYPEHPRNAQAEPPLKYVCRADSRPLLACWWMLGLWVTDTCLMSHQLVLGSGWGSHLTGWFLERRHRDKWL